MLIRFFRYIHSEDVQAPEELWQLYKIWMSRGKPEERTPTHVDSRIKQFVEDMCEVAPGMQTTKVELYEMYMTYSGDFRGISIFARELKALLGNTIIDYRPAKLTNGQRLRGWKGIGLKT